MRLSDVTHPEYSHFYPSWVKWRLVYEGGMAFVENYLKQHKRESNDDFVFRKSITYSPSFAKAAVNEILNAIFQRVGDVARKDGPSTYQAAVRGEDGGVDKLGSSMMTYVGLKILPELLTMAKVGVWVDMPQFDGVTLTDRNNVSPYLYTFWAEDIRSWTVDETGDRDEFSSILLREWSHLIDPDYGYPVGLQERYRHAYKGPDGFVHVEFCDNLGHPISAGGIRLTDRQPIILPLRRIPFVVMRLRDSLLKDVSDYQVALLNMASADVAYAVRSNFPFYTEQFDNRVSSVHLKKPAHDGASPAPGESGPAASTEEIRVGTSFGRRYPINTERPGFINPSPEPLRVSLELRDVMKAEIRQLVQLAVTMLDPTMASAESKSFDQRGLEAGLSAVGLELERGERLISEHWSAYESSPPPTIRYPTSYALQSDAERRVEAKDLIALMPQVASRTFQRELAKEAAYKLVGHRVTRETLETIGREIDDSKAMTADSQAISEDVERGLVSAETASVVRGYPPGEAEKAKQEHAERLARIAASQSLGPQGARGVPDMDHDPSHSAEMEKAASRMTEFDPTVTDKTRGNGKG